MFKTPPRTSSHAATILPALLTTEIMPNGVNRSLAFKNCLKGNAINNSPCAIKNHGRFLYKPVVSCVILLSNNRKIKVMANPIAECTKYAAAAQSDLPDAAMRRTTTCSSPKPNRVVINTETAVVQLKMPKSPFDRYIDIK